MAEVILVYLSIGAVIWLVLDRLGLIGAKFIEMRAKGRRLSAPALVLATAMMILAWPLFVWIWLKGMART